MWSTDKYIAKRDRKWREEGKRLRAKARKKKRNERKRRRRERLLGEMDVVAAYFSEESANWSPMGAQGRRLLRSSPAMQRWRIRVMRQGGGRCARCQSAERVQVDHIEPLVALLKRLRLSTVSDALVSRELFRARNGQLLCHPCHYKKTTEDAAKYGWDPRWVDRVFGRD